MHLYNSTWILSAHFHLRRLGEDDYKVIMKILVGIYQKDRQSESLVEK
jgi:hypothetical protein